MAGYSGTPLPKKLGIQEGQAILVLDAPAAFLPSLGPITVDLDVHTDPVEGPFDLIVWFVHRRDLLEASFVTVIEGLDADGSLWVAWPKKASGVKTDLTEDAVREIGLEVGLVDNKVCAIDDVWSGLRLVVRVANRPAWRAART
jgi:hypothetical protein